MCVEIVKNTIHTFKFYVFYKVHVFFSYNFFSQKRHIATLVT